MSLDNIDLDQVREGSVAAAKAAGMGLGAIWVGVLAVAIPISLTLSVVMPTKKVGQFKGSLTAGELYKRWEEPDDMSKRFKLGDILYRFSIIQCAFLWAYIS